MRFPGSSLVKNVKQKLRKNPPAENLQDGEGVSPGIPPNSGPENIPANPTIALATRSPSNPPRGIHDIVNPFIEPEAGGPPPQDPEVSSPDLPAGPTVPAEIFEISRNEVAADIEPDPPVSPIIPSRISAQAGNQPAADITARPTPVISGQNGGQETDQDTDQDTAQETAQEALEDPIEASLPGSLPDNSTLREMFAKKSVVNPTIKALLERHQPVNTRSLSQELNEFARELGLSRPRK